ncbi:MAG: restriction endonuclease subunit S, partial [Ectothiorhodospiraceae bacterium]
FVDFEPVKAKAAGATSFRGMPQPVFDQLPDRFTDTELGPVPEGWEVMCLEDLAEINPRRTLKKGELAPYLSMSNMPTRGHSPETWEMREFGSGMRFVNGDTLMARITPCLENGKTAFVDVLPEDVVGWGSTEYIVLRPKRPFPNVYAYCLARLTEFRDFAIKNMTGTSGRQRVPASSLAKFKVVKPSESLAETFGETVVPLFEIMAANYKQMRTLASIRDTLLPKLISGELRVPAAGGGVDGG